MTGRVLHLIPTLHAGGAEHQLALLSGSLPAAGWEVHVGYVHSGLHLETLAKTGVHLHPVPARGNYDPVLPWRLVQLIRDTRPDLVQTWLPQMDVAGGVATRIARVPWIVAERSSRPLQDRRVIAAIRERLVSGATAVVSNSRHALTQWERRHGGVLRFHIPNAVVIAEAVTPSDRIACLQQDGSSVAVAVGRLVPSKRFDVFVDAMKIVSRLRPARAVICGEGPERRALTQRAADAGLEERVLFPGFVPDVIHSIKTADVLVALSEYEGRPNAVVEAMAAETPLVVSDIPEHREVVGESALFVDGANAEAVAQAIIEVFDHPQAANARAAAAFEQARRWDPATIAKAYADVYEAVLRSRGAR